MDARISGFAAALVADGPARERAEHLDLYGRFVGDWETDILTHAPDGGRHEGKGEIHFAWVLEGFAIQDIWMIPQKTDRRPGAPAMPVAGNWYGTTLRIYDPSIDAWRINWFDPARSLFRQQIGRREGDEIVQLGTTEAGERTRWSFTRIGSRSFRWQAEVATRADDWRLVVEVAARRV